MFPTRTAVTSAVLSGLFMTAAVPVLADFNGKFPGKGSITAFHASGRLTDQAIAAADRGDYKTAESLTRQAIQVYAYDAQSYFNLGLILNRQKRYKEAEPYLRKSIELQPVFQNWDALGIAIGHEGRYQEAEQAFKNAENLARTERQRQGVAQDEAILHERIRTGAK